MTKAAPLDVITINHVKFFSNNIILNQVMEMEPGTKFTVDELRGKTSYVGGGIYNNLKKLIKAGLVNQLPSGIYIRTGFLYYKTEDAKEREAIRQGIAIATNRDFTLFTLELLQHNVITTEGAASIINFVNEHYSIKKQ